MWHHFRFLQNNWACGVLIALVISVPKTAMLLLSLGLPWDDAFNNLDSDEAKAVIEGLFNSVNISVVIFIFDSWCFNALSISHICNELCIRLIIISLMLTMRYILTGDWIFHLIFFLFQLLQNLLDTIEGLLNALITGLNQYVQKDYIVT